MSYVNNTNPNSADSDWGTSDNYQEPQDDGWGDWDNTQEQQPQQDDWGNDWNNDSGQFVGNDNASWDVPQEVPQEAGQPQQNSENRPVAVNFGIKTIGFIVAGAFVLLALILLFINGLKFDKKPDVVQQPQQQVQQEQSTGNTTQPNVQSGGVTLIEIPQSTAMTYSMDVYETSGTVSCKTKYVQGHQVLYCIQIKIAVGSSMETINYYCNYASYNAVSVGDLLFIKYQQIDDSYISVNEISK